MSSILSDIQTILQVIKQINDLRKLIKSNKNQCQILFDYCSDLQIMLEKVKDNPYVKEICEGIINGLSNTIQESFNFVKEYSHAGFIQKSLNVLKASRNASKIESLNEDLEKYCNQLKLGLQVVGVGRVEEIGVSISDLIKAETAKIQDTT